MTGIYEMPFEQFVEWALSDEPAFGTPFSWMKAWAKRRDEQVTQLEELLKDVPGDTLEQKIRRIFHELQIAHERIAQLKAENETLNEKYGTQCTRTVELLKENEQLRKRCEADDQLLDRIVHIALGGE